MADRFLCTSKDDILNSSAFIIAVSWKRVVHDSLIPLTSKLVNLKVILEKKFVFHIFKQS